MSWLYCHHYVKGCGVSHMITRGTVINNGYRLKVKGGKHFNEIACVKCWSTWGDLFVVNLDTGMIFESPSSNGKSRAEAHPWVFDPMLRAIKVAELKEKERRKRRRK